MITGNLYSDTEAANIPEAALLASLGCGNPTALASLHEGEILCLILDLAAGSTFYFRLAGLARLALPTVST